MKKKKKKNQHSINHISQSAGGEILRRLNVCMCGRLRQEPVWIKKKLIVLRINESLGLLTLKLFCFVCPIPRVKEHFV